MADKRSPEVHKSLRDQGFDVRANKRLTVKDYRGNFIHIDTGHEEGESDLLCGRSGLSVAIEIKNHEDGFVTKDWRQDQREWALKCETQIGSEYYLWLLTGSDPPHYNPEKYTPRVSYLIPYKAVIDTVEQVEKIQKRIPYRIKKGMNKLLQSNKYDCENLFKDYKLKWNKGWEIPETHPFFMKYMEKNNEPGFRRNTEKVRRTIRNGNTRSRHSSKRNYESSGSGGRNRVSGKAKRRSAGAYPRNQRRTHQ